MGFLTSLNKRIENKRQSQRALASALDQSPTETESDWLHGINITRFSEMFKHQPARFKTEIARRVAWQCASDKVRREIMSAIETHAALG